MVNKANKAVADDPDYDWMCSLLPKQPCITERDQLADRLADVLKTKIADGELPYTLGVFGGWGAGKTTFLAMLAQRLETFPKCKVVYFNSWKYAGFMEIVPALIYKILKYGIQGTNEKRNEAAMRVLLSLGKQYSDSFGEWAKQRIGINPTTLFREVANLAQTASGLKDWVRPELLAEYYNQVDKAQDELVEAIGEVPDNRQADNSIIVLIDELDRCDPDEAYMVIKQMRVLFAMRRLPIAFVLCANPDPIGLAIKHRYGLETDNGDYESRRILEKFVDAYEDLSGSTSLGALTKILWSGNHEDYIPYIVKLDDANGDVGYIRDTMRNASAFDCVETSIDLYSNLRVLEKSLVYVAARPMAYGDLRWTLWHLQIVGQIDPAFRQQISRLSKSLAKIARESYRELSHTRYVVESHDNSRTLTYQTDKGRTAFSIFRSCFWEAARSELMRLELEQDPEVVKTAEALKEILSNHRRMTFLIMLCLLPFNEVEDHHALAKKQQGTLPDLYSAYNRWAGRFGYILVNS